MVILDKIDKTLLSELDKNCRASSITLARAIRKSRQTVDYRIQQLQAKGVITGFHAAFNPHKIGQKIYKIYLKLRNIPEQKEQLITYLRSSKSVYWMGECSGSWDLIFGIHASTDQVFFETKNKIIAKFNKIILKEAEGTLLDVKQYPKMYFTKKLFKPVMFGGEIEKNTLDALDKSILEKLVHNARAPAVAIAKELGVTATKIIRRIKKLEQKKIIIQYRIGVDLNKLSLGLYKAIIKLDKYTKKDDLKFQEYISRILNVQYFIRNLWQIEVELVVASYQEYYEIIDKIKKEFPEIIRNVDSVLMRTDEWTPGFSILAT